MSKTALQPTMDDLLQQARRRGNVLLSEIAWTTYRELLDGSGERPSRFTYDRGYLEVMTRSWEHETYKSFLSQMVHICVEEMDLTLAVGGERTFDREDLERGLEPDDCYWIQNEPKVRGKFKLRSRRIPPPDLAIEIEVSRTILNRLDVYAALRVPEVWRCNGKTFLVGLLQKEGHYNWGFTSRAFPGLPMNEFQRYLNRLGRDEQMSILRSFRNWVRQQLAKQ